MEPTKKTARIAGFFYLLLIISGIISIMYVPSKLIFWDDPTKTVVSISNSQLIFQLGVVSGLICYTCFIIVPLALYKLLESVDRKIALLMVIFAIVSVPISYLNMVKLMDVLVIVNSAEMLEMTTDHVSAGVMLLLESHHNGNMVAFVFWGLWLLPFGYLVYKSGFLPKFLGIMLMLGCFGYLIDFFGYFLFDGYGKTLFSTIVGIPSSVGEIGICLWLLIVGIKTDKGKSLRD